MGVYIDEALNVVCPWGVTEEKPVVVVMAHMDTVFPDTEPMPFVEDKNRFYCPGVCDDTAQLAQLMILARYFIKYCTIPKSVGIVFVANSCEEGLGNLKGSRKIMEDFGSRVIEFVTFDGYANKIANTTVGSKRYKVEVATEGGHSYSAFGNHNAIAYLASLISTLYDIKVPTRGKTTFNVGTISGGTSVNTIAQSAEMLYEFRSDNREDLAEMEEHFKAAIDFYRTKGIEITVTQVGDRPCMGDVDPAREQVLMERGERAIKNHYGYDVEYSSSSTDCNIPMSLGIPSICVGTVVGGKAHAREEYVEIESLLPGLKVAAEMILHHF